MAKRVVDAKKRIEKPEPVANVFRITLHVARSLVDGSPAGGLVDEVELFIIAADDAEAREKAIVHAEENVFFVSGLDGGYSFSRGLLRFAEIEFVARIDVR